MINLYLLVGKTKAIEADNVDFYINIIGADLAKDSLKQKQKELCRLAKIDESIIISIDFEISMSRLKHLFSDGITHMVSDEQLSWDSEFYYGGLTKIDDDDDDRSRMDEDF